jgi:hypothetical protein
MSDYHLNRVLYEKARAHKMIDAIGPDELSEYDLTPRSAPPWPRATSRPSSGWAPTRTSFAACSAGSSRSSPWAASSRPA